MLDPSHMYPESFHPVRMSRSRDFRHKAKAYTRTRQPSSYLLIDFGLSRYYDPANGPPLDKPLRGGDKTAPEHEDRTTLCNPFPTDVYYLGNFVREYFMQVCVSICDRENVLIVHGPEISRVRFYGTTHHRHGPGRSNEASKNGRGRHTFSRDKRQTQFLETTLPDSPARRDLAGCSMAIRWSLVSNRWLRLGS